MSAAMSRLASHSRQMSVSQILHRPSWLTNCSGHCRTSQVLSPGPWHHISDSARPLYSDIRLLSRGTHTAIPSPAQWDDMASNASVNRHVHRVAQGSQQACQRMDHISTQVFRAHLHRRGRILLFAWITVPCIKFFQRDYMVCTSEHCRCQSCKLVLSHVRSLLNCAVWSCIRTWHVSCYIRLGSDCLHRLPIGDTVLGCHEYCGRPCGCDVVRGAFYV
jgi:hypothetical protein